jgi:uncharacterized membrane protein YeaQ/YmgE (transglycosylase-associated protein family)
MMAVLGWIALGLAAAVLASGFRRGEERRAVLAGRCAIGMVGALLAGLAATAAGVGPIGDFFHTGTWLIALGGAVLALLAYEFATRTRGRRGTSGPATRFRAGRAGGESERLDRNW